MKEETVSAAGYIITFFNDIESLTNSLGYYSNLMLRVKNKYPTKELLEKMMEAEKTETIRITQDMRFWITRTYVKFSALKEKIKEFQEAEETIEKKYKEISRTPTPEMEKIQDYAIELNKLFVKGVVSNLLTKAYDVYAQFKQNA